jgi:hypothetical protein
MISATHIRAGEAESGKTLHIFPELQLRQPVAD